MSILTSIKLLKYICKEGRNTSWKEEHLSGHGMGLEMRNLGFDCSI
jgi:hypothetical protein